MRAKAQAWNRKNRERFNVNKRASYRRMKDTKSGQARVSNYQRFREKVRAEVYAAYGGAHCACCGESNIQFLTIDHINNNGAEHHREVWGGKKGTGSAVCGWLKKYNYPPGFQVMCYNCNCGKQRNGGICPHLTNEGVTTIPSGSTPKWAEARSTQ